VPQQVREEEQAAGLEEGGAAGEAEGEPGDAAAGGGHGDDEGAVRLTAAREAAEEARGGRQEDEAAVAERTLEGLREEPSEELVALEDGEADAAQSSWKQPRSGQPSRQPSARSAAAVAFPPAASRKPSAEVAVAASKLAADAAPHPAWAELTAAQPQPSPPRPDHDTRDASTLTYVPVDQGPDAVEPRQLLRVDSVGVPGIRPLAPDLLASQAAGRSPPRLLRLPQAPRALQRTR
jgi:hypothetical protein